MNPDKGKKKSTMKARDALIDVCELAVRLKCAIMVMYDSEELGSCCEKDRTHLTNGLHILLSFPHLTPNKCASEGRRLW